MLGLFSAAGFGEEAEVPPPSMELIEFLAGWETEEGEQIDPFQLLESEALAEENSSTESDDD